jgi:hypothetical protein
MNQGDLETYYSSKGACQILLTSAIDTLALSARPHDRILKGAPSVADLESVENISENHLLEAIYYRSLYRKSFKTVSVLACRLLSPRFPSLGRKSTLVKYFDRHSRQYGYTFHKFLKKLCGHITSGKSTSDMIVFVKGIVVEIPRMTYSPRARFICYST